VEKESRQKNLDRVYLEEVYLFSADFKTAKLLPVLKYFACRLKEMLVIKLKSTIGIESIDSAANSYLRMAKKGATLYCEKNWDCRKIGYRSHQEGR